jgi:hypothetical protein
MKKELFGQRNRTYNGVVVPFLYEIDSDSIHLPSPATINLPLPLELYGRIAYSQNHFIEIVGKQHYLRDRTTPDFCRSLFIESFFVDKDTAAKSGIHLADSYHVNAVYLRYNTKMDYMVGVSNYLDRDFLYFFDVYKSDANLKELPAIVQLLYKKSVALDDVFAIAMAEAIDPNASDSFRNRVIQDPEMLEKYFEKKKLDGYFSDDINYKMAMINREKDGLQLTDYEYFEKYGIER